MFLKILLYSFILSFTGNDQDFYNKKITITGTAENSKAYAVVITSDGPYFIPHLSHWNDHYLGKKVKVTGRLVIKNHEAQSTHGKQVQEMAGTIRYIKRAKVSLAE